MKPGTLFNMMCELIDLKDYEIVNLSKLIKESLPILKEIIEVVNHDYSVSYDYYTSLNIIDEFLTDEVITQWIDLNIIKKREEDIL